ncbi:conjugal transfer protein TraN [Cupriavidus sp. 2SB]|jgi:conjugal transfer mating pair stabilization protein TraN|uniref:conjugal transfer protein TraN n=2 Tax=unclassified Cupriavidus TaxID=2640874 RepID=UPI0010F8720A|nr:conjugal transfer protein TraN [Cupriavidus sp. 2SB]
MNNAWNTPWGRRVLSVILGLIGFLFVAAPLEAAECRRVGEVCVEGGGVRNIGGTDVYRDCWRYRDTFECKKPESIDYCAPFYNLAGCWQTSTKCIAAAWDGTCLTEQRTYRCDDPSMPPPPNTVVLDKTYTITKDALDTKQCDPYSTNPLCTLASHKCVEPAETRVINGLPVYKSCWRWQDDYACIDPTPKNDCQEYIDKGCKKLDEVCIESTDPVGCVMKQITYKCVTKEGQTTTGEDCSGRTSCYDGTCWDTGYPGDDDFARVVAGKEAAREAGVYGAESNNFFKGVAESCRKGFGGLKNCCKTDPGAKSNNTIMMQAAGGAVKFGAKYAFDYMYKSSEWIQAGMSALGYDGIEMASNFGASFGMYGVSYTVGGTALAAGETTTGMFGQTIYGLGNGFAFDPYSFAAAIAIQIVMELMSCEQDEMQLGMHRGAHLCHLVGSYCSNKVMGVCLETKEAYCCYNSKLAKIINEQGKPQIGKGWGTPESPNCEGFTTAEFQQIDFSAIDMSEFVGDIMAATELPNIDDIQKRMSEKMKDITTNPTIPVTNH